MMSEQKMTTSIWGTLMFSSTGDIGRQMKIDCLCDSGRRYRAKTNRYGYNAVE